MKAFKTIAVVMLASLTGLPSLQASTLAGLGGIGADPAATSIPMSSSSMVSIPMSSQAAVATQQEGGGNDADELAKKLSNPIAAMISVPFQSNFDWGGGPRGDGFQYKMNIQPVIPFHINDRWNLIARTIIPVIQQDDIAGTYARPSGSQFGLGDTLFSGWFSPVAPTSSGWIWGVGPALVFPTGTDSMLTGNQWGAGPTAIVLKPDGKFTYGMLVNHLWSYGGTGGRSRLNQTFVQPFFSYVPGGGWTYSINTETSYDWTGSQWTIPINLMVSKMFNIGKVPAQWQAGIRYYAAKPANGADWGARLALTLLFPD